MVPVPYFMEDNVRFTHVAVDVVQGKDMLFHIIYLATGMFMTHDMSIFIHVQYLFLSFFIHCYIFRMLACVFCKFVT